jgi:hypothetical protein
MNSNESKELQEYNNVIISLDKKVTPFIDNSIYSEIFNQSTLNVFKCIIILFIIKMKQINPKMSENDILPLIKQSGGVFTVTNSKKNEEDTSYNFTEIFKLIVAALIFISLILVDISYINNLKGKIFEPITQTNIEMGETSNQLVTVKPIDNSVMIELENIYDQLYLQHQDAGSETFKIALYQIKDFSQMIKNGVENGFNSLSRLPLIERSTEIFDYTLVNVINKLLVPKNHKLVISSLINEKYTKVMNDNSQIVNIRVKAVIDEIKVELIQISEEFKKLNDPNLFNRFNNMVQSGLIYLISPQAAITTANIKIDKIINIISKAKYIRNDIEAGLEQLFNDGRQLAKEYSNQIVNDVVVLHYLLGLTITFGSLFLYHLKNHKKSKINNMSMIPEEGEYQQITSSDASNRIRYDPTGADVEDYNESEQPIVTQRRQTRSSIPRIGYKRAGNRTKSRKNKINKKSMKKINKKRMVRKNKTHKK